MLYGGATGQYDRKINDDDDDDDDDDEDDDDDDDDGDNIKIIMINTK